MRIDLHEVRRLVQMALEEDGAHNDVTTLSLVPRQQRGKAVFLAKSQGVLAGLPVAKEAFAAFDSSLSFIATCEEGTRFQRGDVLAQVDGSLASILSAERVALNYLQRMCGIATLTRQMVDAIGELPARLVDTRKTTPGLRVLERYAVRIGGAHNHRLNLSDAVLIKDNHIAAALLRGLSLTEVIQASRDYAPHTMRIEVEVTTYEEAVEAVEAAADIVLLDNMSLDEMRRCVEMGHGRCLFEASGGITLESVRAVAETGVDLISSGSLTHSAPSLDISLEVEAV